jgi:luciferase family oxidoreductase group 1
MPRRPALRLSILDLSPVPSGSSSGQALQNTLDLARLADGLGYHRTWLAEHHNSEGVASSSPEVLIGHVASVTTRMRVGAGGIMLPNHSSLKVAELFRTLEALHPGRIDLGIGRAPGTDGLTAAVLRRSQAATARDEFPAQLGELLAFLGEGFPADHPYRRLKAVPADAGPLPVWMLSSSGYGAQAASQLGLGLAFAHHIHPDPCIPSMRLYREQFQPSLAFPRPQAILTVAALCAPTREEAEELASSFDLVRLRLGQGKTGPFPSVAEALAYPYDAADQALIQQNRSRFFVGTAKDVKDQLVDLAGDCGADEVMVMTMVHEHALRRRSYELLAKAFKLGTA